MWSFSFVVPTFLILMIIIIFYFSLPRLDIRMNRFFVQLVAIEMVTIIIDIASSFADNQYTLMPLQLVNFLNFLFFASFFTRSLIMYRFTFGVLGVSVAKSALMKQVIRTPYYACMIITLLSPFFGLIYTVDEFGYHFGKLYNLIYVNGLFYILMSFYAVSKYRKRLSGRRERYSMLLYNLILLSGLIIRYFLNRYLLMDTFVLMAIVVVYLAFMNPEYFLELRGVVFNSIALREYINEHIDDLDDRCMGMVVHRYYEMRDIYGAVQTDVGLNMIGRYLRQICPKGKIFYYRRGRFIIFGDKDVDFKELSSRITARFRNPWVSKTAELFFDVGFATIELNNDVESSDVILNTMIKALSTVDSTDSQAPLEVTEDELFQTEKEIKIKRSLETAIENNTVELFLQPLIDAETGKIVGAEALSRIRDENGGLIQPGNFIHIAEKSGRINELGEQIFEKTCRFIKDNDLVNMGVKWINVNLSPLQFLRKDLADRYSGILKKYDIDPEMIHLEITEESTIDDCFLKRQIQALSEKGFKFVLDDYGTGYSNLSRLKKCPFINIKLDITIVRDFCKEPDEILPTMISAFKQMGFGITSEGVEDDCMADAMKRIGCDYLQGFYYSRPLPAEDFAKTYAM
ncbi:MAG: EAL domain-containing protein [Lachnospiraceae bacterium]|nr:EAL domain-containing protein [Lachnospiraceae bacterium]